MKIDIEGADLVALQALRRREERPRLLSIESEKVNFDALRAEVSLLCELGYRKFRAVQQQNIPGRALQTKTLDGADLTYVFEPDASGPFGDDLAQPWRTADEVVDNYRAIFKQYRLFGDRSPLKRAPDASFGRTLRESYRRASGEHGPLPGWYDTHASL